MSVPRSPRAHAEEDTRVPAESLLAFAEATVGYARNVVVTDAVLEVHPGEVLGLVGPNGAGKSTLLRAVTGDAELFAGTITLAGRDVAELSSAVRARLVGVVPQQVSAAFSVSAREFVAMGRHPHIARFSAPGEHDVAVVERALTLTDTARLADTPTDQLSGGDLQRLALAQALAQEPRVLLLDEPTSHLDLNHRLQVLDLVRDLAREQGLGILAVFHDLDLAARYSDRIAVVASGRLSTAGAPADVITTATVREVFGVRAVVGLDPVTGTVSVTPVLRDGAVATGARGRVLVIGGSGAGAGLMRRFVLAGWSVSAGALNSGDADQILALALGIEYPLIPPFAPLDAAASGNVDELASAADAIVVSEVPFGHGNVGNLRAAVKACLSGTTLILVGDIEDRDFTGGEARRLWSQAVDAGCVCVRDAAAAQLALESEPRQSVGSHANGRD